MKIIHILSTSNDKSTIEVLDWLICNNVVFKRYNDKLDFPRGGIHISNFDFNIKKCTNSPNTDKTELGLDKYWYRRGGMDFIKIKLNFFSNFNYVSYVEQDDANYRELVNFYFKKMQSINTPADNNINKLVVYYHAKDLELRFPSTWIVDCVKKIPLSSGLLNNSVLTKSLNVPNLIVKYLDFEIQFHSGSILIDKKLLEKKTPSNKFYPSLFQEYIEKKYELRIFYLNGIFKCMAIFSQQNEKTKIDFRNYDGRRPNRLVPYLLPKFLEKKLHKLMLKLEINCGSIDVLVTPNDQYYFLEVNPIGQFQWLSKNCNFFIERMIAKNLVEI